MTDKRQFALKQRFHDRLKSDAGTLNECAHALEVEDQEAEIVRLIHHTAHKLAGAAGVFDYPSLAELAADLELLVESGCDPEDIAEACRVIAGEIHAQLAKVAE